MHPGNTEKQNTELTSLLLKIDSYYYAAIRRPSRHRPKLAEGLGEIYWKANNHRYRDVIDAVRFAARNFRRAAKAPLIEDAMRTFSVRPEEAPAWKPVCFAGVDGIARGLPPGSVVLAHVRPGRGGNAMASLFAVAA